MSDATKYDAEQMVFMQEMRPIMAHPRHGESEQEFWTRCAWNHRQWVDGALARGWVKQAASYERHALACEAHLVSEVSL